MYVNPPARNPHYTRFHTIYLESSSYRQNQPDSSHFIFNPPDSSSIESSVHIRLISESSCEFLLKSPKWTFTCIPTSYIRILLAEPLHYLTTLNHNKDATLDKHLAVIHLAHHFGPSSRKNPPAGNPSGSFYRRTVL